ncbi:MAG: Ig-like domain-containing protein [Clostridia bacterium]|nr:Ig-like domain-containing protein [Clostridia bacterium]MBQ5769638.1 Ig-like domain-containing protein [Clostridia bacterium]
MKKTAGMLFIAAALFACLFPAFADAFFLPNGLRQIEEEAFYDIGAIDSAFIPKSVNEISETAFSGRVTHIIGYPNSAAEAFAGKTGRVFIPVSVPVTEETFIPVSSISLSCESEDAPVTGETVSLSAKTYPEDCSVTYISMHPDIAAVNQAGEITCVSAGRTEILCFSNDGSGAYAHFPLTVHQGVEKITLSVPENTMLPGKMMKITASVSPEGALKSGIVFSSSNPSIASVDNFGLVTAKKPGVATITAASENGVSASVTLRVHEEGKPQSFTVSPSSVTLSVGDTYSLTHKALPEGTQSAATWYSSSASIAQVSSSGVVTAKSGGTCYIYVQSTVDENVFASCKVTVLSDSRTLTMPLRRTGTSEVSANLTRIDNVKASAFTELQSLYTKGKISSSDMSNRKNVISNAFSMYSFPWMTKGYQEYWKEANSENGAKDFKPGIVYYGLPYISDYQNRLYNVSKAVSENRYTTAPKGYYLNQNNLLNGKYVGNDCSSMLSISFFGFNSQTANFNTRSFYSSDLFTTLSASDTLMPGDILVRNGRHVVMFLYYANNAKTQIVVIEQGGSEAGINTVSTGLYSLSYYLSNGYIPRRLTAWT